MVVTVDFYAFCLVGLSAVALIVLGLKFHYFGAVGGIVLFLEFAYMVAYSANLTAPDSSTVILNFALSSSNFMWGSYGLLGCLMGLGFALLLK